MFLKRKIVEYYCNGLFVTHSVKDNFMQLLSRYYCIRIDLILGGELKLGGGRG